MRAKVVEPVRERACELLLEARAPVISHMTPHTLRRTFASVLAELDVSARRAMRLMGHTTPHLTLGVYAQVLDVPDSARDVLEGVLGGSAAELHEVLAGRTEGRSAGSHDDVRTDSGQNTPEDAQLKLPEEWS
jgi:hypothetical protein